jgi:hypothetical protein
MVGSPDDVLAKLQEAGRKNLGDFMTFEVVPDDDHPEIQNDGMQYDGLRFRTGCKLAGKLYGQAFGVDVAFGDPILGEPEVVVAEDVLAFAGIAPPTLRLYRIETHIAEKLHAYLRARRRGSSTLVETAEPAARHRPRARGSRCPRHARWPIGPEARPVARAPPRGVPSLRHLEGRERGSALMVRFNSRR